MGFPKGGHHSEETKLKMRETGVARAAAGLWVPPNKGKGKRYSEPRHIRVDKGLPLFCNKHGEHTEWRRKHQGVPLDDAVCRKCSQESSVKWQRANHFKMLLSRGARENKRRKHPESDLTEEFLVSLLVKQGGCCALTGKKFDSENRASIDRVDSGCGYSQSKRPTNSVSSQSNEKRFETPRLYRIL